MDTGRKANREGHEITLHYRTRQEMLLLEELNEEKLTNLLLFVSRLARTPPGAAELQRRSKTFGKCDQMEGETSAQFYGRLRHWLDRDLPQTKVPLHAPRQTDD